MNIPITIYDELKKDDIIDLYDNGKELVSDVIKWENGKCYVKRPRRIKDNLALDPNYYYDIEDHEDWSGASDDNSDR
jgi:hypothetical protein